jgi:uncharacterized membrane protein
MEHKSKITLGTCLKRYLVAGLATVGPLFITFYFIFIIFKIANKFAGSYINDLLINNYGFSIPGLGFIFLLITIVIIGAFVSNFIGKKIFTLAERFFYKTPLIANIYPSAKKLSDFLFNEEQQKKFRKVVLVEYPSPGSYSIGFLTNEGLQELNEKIGNKLITVLVPLSPMPYSGLLLILPKDKLIEVDMTVNDAVKLVLSGGVVIPESK